MKDPIPNLSNLPTSKMNGNANFGAGASAGAGADAGAGAGADARWRRRRRIREAAFRGVSGGDGSPPGKF